MKLAFDQQNREKIIKKAHFAFIAAYFIIHKMCCMDDVNWSHSSQFMEWQNIGVTTLEHTTCTPKCFLKVDRKSNNYQFHLYT